MDETTIDRIDRFVGSGGSNASSRSKVIRDAVRDYLARMDRMNEEERERVIYRKHRARLARQTAVLVREQGEP